MSDDIGIEEVTRSLALNEDLPSSRRQVFATLYVGDQLGRIADALEKPEVPLSGADHKLRDALDRTDFS